MPPHDQFPVRLRRLRRRRKLTQMQAAARAGIEQAAWSRYETPGGPMPKLPTLRRLAAALGVGLDELAG